LKQEGADRLDIINEKNIIIDRQRVKINQYEFAIQEALQFLGKPLKKFNNWIDGETSDDFRLDVSVSINEIFNKNSERITNHQPKYNSNLIGASSDFQSTNSMRSSVPSRQKSSSSPVSRQVSSSTESLGMTKLEVVTLECMRMCFIFLRNCQIQNLAIDNGTYVIPLSDQEIKAKENSDISMTQLPGLPSKDVVHLDLDFKPNRSVTTPNLNHRESGETVEDLQKYIHGLEERLQKEIKARKITQKGKDVLDAEIEGITAELFARANEMVVSEARKVDALQTKIRIMDTKLALANSMLKDKEEILVDTLNNLYLNQSAKITESTYSLESIALTEKVKSPTTPKTPLQSPTSPLKFAHSIVSGHDQFKNYIAADGIIFLEFQEFMRIVMLSPTMLATNAYSTIHNSLYMKRCMVESIEPCLYYDYSHSGKFSSLLHGSKKKQLLDFCIKGYIFVKPVPPSNDKNSAIVKTKCTICVLIRECEYLMGFGQPDYSKPLCRFCRDRTLSVQDFFGYITYLANNTHQQNHSVMAAFKQLHWMRRRIALAYVGSCSMFETELSAVQGPGGGGNWERYCDILY
jgi:hypothetical protein